MTSGAAIWRHDRKRIDVEALKQAHPIQDVVARYGVELRRQGRAAVGRCPLHPDHGRPNLHVWADTQSWWCFRCNVGGDAIRFVELAEALSFSEAVERLTNGAQLYQTTIAPCTTPSRAAALAPAPVAFDQRDTEEMAVLRTATWLYHQRLLTDSTALAYLERRGIDGQVIGACRVGYAAGDELVPALRWRCLPLGPALRVGLLTHCGREFLTGRIIVPELRECQPVWLVGRLLEPVASTSSDDGSVACTTSDDDSPPKYLALRGSKPLLGFEQACSSPAVIVVEGAFDVLTLRMWGYPAVALGGTHARPDVVDQLRVFQHVYLALDQDDAGLEATLRFMDALSPNAIPVALPDGVKDIAELAPRADGRAVFAAALLEAVGAAPPAAAP